MRAEAKALVLGFAPRWLGHRDLQHGGSADTCPLLREQGRFFPDRSPRLRIAAQPAAPHLHGRFNTNTIPLDDVDAVMNDCVTISSKGRSVSIHPDEALLIELRERQQTSHGRAKLRERVAVEHTLAHVGRWQGRRARYLGARKNLFDLRRCAVVHNLHVLARSQQAQIAA